VTYKLGGKNLEKDMRRIMTLQAQEAQFSGGSVVDHGTLLGLADDDHPQYGLLAGAETVTGDWNFANGLTIGGDVDLSRGVANRLDLASGDSLRIVSGQLQFGADVALSRGAANRLDLASGDSLSCSLGQTWH